MWPAARRPRTATNKQIVGVCSSGGKVLNELEYMQGYPGLEERLGSMRQEAQPVRAADRQRLSAQMGQPVVRSSQPPFSRLYGML